MYQKIQKHLSIIHSIILNILIVFLLRQNIQFYSRSIKNLKKLNSQNTQKVCTKEKKEIVYNNASELYNVYVGIHGCFRCCNMILFIYFLLIPIIMITGLKITNRLIQQAKVIKKNLLCHCIQRY